MLTPNNTELDDEKAYPLFVKLYEDLEQSNSKIAQKVWNLLNEEQFNVVITHGTNDTFNFETSTYGKLPNYAYDFLVKYIPRQYGLKYVYEDL